MTHPDDFTVWRRLGGPNLTWSGREASSSKKGRADRSIRTHGVIASLLLHPRVWSKCKLYFPSVPREQKRRRKRGFGIKTEKGISSGCSRRQTLFSVVIGHKVGVSSERPCPPGNRLRIGKQHKMVMSKREERKRHSLPGNIKLTTKRKNIAVRGFPHRLWRLISYPFYGCGCCYYHQLLAFNSSHVPH